MAEKECEDNNINGLVILAKEGVNGTLSGFEKNLDRLIELLTNEVFKCDMNVKEAFSKTAPFARIKVKIKKEIVTFGVDNISSYKQRGRYVEPSEWNDLISKDDIVTIDTRNDYEVSIGTFKNSINPKIKSFRNFPNWVQKNLIDKKVSKKSKIGMFCTGGIRCEKSTSYLKQLGFENVFHLDGGILKYLENVKSDQNEWKGECFVFDYRVSLNDSLEKGEYDMCYACRMPLNKENKKNKHYLKGQSCEYCYDQTTIKQKKRFNEREKQIKLSKVRNLKHLGPKD